MRVPMRLHRPLTAAATALGALALALSLPAAPAGAATGYFAYVYEDRGGGSHLGVLSDPPSGQCITLREVDGEFGPPAHSPRNLTSSSARVYAGTGCTGNYFTLRPNGGHASERLKFRSVAFF